MKKLIGQVLVVGLVFVFTSCKKDYTCTCTSTVNGVSTTSSTTINDTKSNAKASCDEGDASTTTSGVTATVECELE